MSYELPDSPEPLYPSGVLIYAPPRGLVGRLRNAVRRWLGWDAQDEPVAFFGAGELPPGITIEWTRAGIFSLAPDDEDTGKERTP